MRKFFAPIAVMALFIAILFIGSCHNGSNSGVIEDLSAKVKRGDYLVNAVANCMHCHASRDFTKFSGPVIPGTEGMGGQRKGVYVSNITPTALGKWTDEEIERAITTGITNVGDTLLGTMPYMSYQHLTKYDAESIVAYLRTLKPLIDTVPDRDLSVLPPGLLNKLYHDFYVDDIYKKIEHGPLDEVAKKGKYLTILGGCLGCHSNLDTKVFEYKTDSLFAGGLISNRPANNYKVISANITPDTTTGIGVWTEAVFLAKFKSYRKKDAYDYDPGRNNSEMPWTIFANMTDEDIKSIYRFLRTVKPIQNKITKWPQ